MPKRTIVIVHLILDIKVPINSLHLAMWLLKSLSPQITFRLRFKKFKGWTILYPWTAVTQWYYKTSCCANGSSLPSYSF